MVEERIKSGRASLNLKWLPIVKGFLKMNWKWTYVYNLIIVGPKSSGSP